MLASTLTRVMMTTLRRTVTSLGALSILTLTGCGTSQPDSSQPSSQGGTTSVASSTPAPTSGASASGADASSATSSDAASGTSAAPSPAGASTASGPATKSTGARGQGAGTGTGAAYDVVSVVDGDTIKVRLDGRKETIRIIGLDTPETKKPRTPVQCFGKEASSHMQSLVQSKQVQLVADSSQGDRDRYGRLLRHVFVDGSTNVALAQIEGGYGREETYDGPYAHRLEYLAAQNQAKNAHRGTWGPPCNGFHKDDAGQGVTASSPAPSSSTPTAPAAARPGSVPSRPVSPSTTGSCTIKGNINSKGAKIAHAPGSATYDKTRIDTSKGERMFCSAAEAVAAGWRMAND